MALCIDFLVRYEIVVEYRVRFFEEREVRIEMRERGAEQALFIPYREDATTISNPFYDFI